MDERHPQPSASDPAPEEHSTMLSDPTLRPPRAKETAPEVGFQPRHRDSLESMGGDPQGQAAPWPAIPPYVERVAVVLAVVLGLAFAASTLGEVYRHFKWAPRVDFTMYHNAAQTVLAKQSLYHFHEVGGFRAGSLPYPYPPLLGCLLAPLGKLSLGAAYPLWVGFLLASLGLLVWLTARVVREAGGPRPLLLALGAFFLSFVLLDSNVYWGQVNIPVMVLVAAGLYLLQRGRSAWAGALVGAAAAIKLLPAALALWFLVRRDWRALGACVLTFLAGVLAVPALVGGAGWAVQMNREWLELLTAALTKGSRGLQSNGGYVVGYKNGSLVAIFDRFFGGGGMRGHLVTQLPQATIDSIAKATRLTLFVASIAATVRLAWRRAPEVQRWLAPLTFSLLLLLGWLVNLLLWDHHTIGLLLILPVIAGAALDARIAPAWRRPLWVALFASATALASGWFDGSRRWGLQTWCFLVTWAGIAWAMVTAPAPDPEPAPEPVPALQLELELDLAPAPAPPPELDRSVTRLGL